MAYYLGARSQERLLGIKSELVDVVELAILMTRQDFTVLEGLRSKERQAMLVEKGASTTMNSRHLTGHAVDLGAYVDGEISWHWPLYHEIYYAMDSAAYQLDIDITWGGDWKSFPDGPHYELSWSTYNA